MNFDLTAFKISDSKLVLKQAANEIVKLNAETAQFGLYLTGEQAMELAETRDISLKDSGRIELGVGIILNIIKTFCDSPYLSKYNYADTINELVEMFYYYKNETMDLISDQELLEWMKASFDGVCEGSIELLGSREMERMARNVRFGRDPFSPGAFEEADEDEVRGEEEEEDYEYGWD
ncbi:MAG: DUF6323 family protein [Clostridiales bacterium]|nr:DUF6323 family protein [Clostridiales bacterium]